MLIPPSGRSGRLSRRPRWSWRPTRWSAVLLPLVGAAGVIALWWLLIELLDIKPIILPTPADVVRSFQHLPRYLLEQSWSTLTVTLIGYGLATVTGLVTAVLLTSSRALEQAMLPVLVAANAVPKIAVAPLLLLWMDFGPAPRIFMAALLSVFPIVVSAMSGLTSAPAELIELAASLSASRWQTYRKLRFPWALPQIFVGLKLAVSLAVIGAVIGEFSGGDRGLGYVVVASGGSADTALAFAAIGLLSLMSVILFYLVVAVERLLLPWAREITG